MWHVSQVSCHISCNVLHVSWHVTENYGKFYIFETRMTQGLQYDMWYVSQVPCDMSCVMCYMSHCMWQSEFETFRKWWQVLYFWNQDDSRITIGHMTCVTDVMWHFMCHVLHVAWHVTEWIWDILKIMASTIFLKIGWLKDYYGTYGMCHRCDVTFHVMCYMSHDMWQS